MATPIRIGNVIGGVNYTFPPDELPSYYMADSQNILPTGNGYARQRAGSAKLNTIRYANDIITTFHELIVGTTSYKFCTMDEFILIYSDTYRMFNVHYAGLTPDLYGQWLNYGDYAIYANGADNVIRTTATAGTTADLTANLSGIPGGRCLTEWGERVWVGGYTGEEAMLLGSALRAPTDFNTAGDAGYWYGYVGNKNQPIIALCTFFDIMLIGKLNQIYMMTGAPETDTSTYSLKPLQTKDKDSMGFTSKTGIVQVGNDLVFLDGFNLKSLSGIQAYGDVESVSIIANIKDFFRSSSGAGLDKDHLNKAHFFHYKHKEQVYCSIPTGASTRYWFIIDYSNQDLRTKYELPKYSIFPMAGLTPICFGGIENGSKVDIYAGCEDGYVRQLDTGTDDDGSTAVDSHMTWCVGHPERNIQPMDVRLAVKYNAALTLSLSYAMGIGDWAEVRTSSVFSALSDENVLGASWRRENNIAYKLINSFMYNTGKSFTFKIRHNTAGESFEMRSSAIRYALKHRYAG